MTMRIPAVIVALLALAAYPAAGDAQDRSRHEMDHGAHVPPSPSGPSVSYLTINVSVSDEGVQPSSVFVPAGQLVQLMLRGRGTSEHHYRVVGLTPDELWWMMPATGGGGEHDHHSMMFATSRAPSQAGIAPTGEEVHGYVSGARNVEVVLFTATQTGTFDVVCDLHPDVKARLTVFDPSAPQRPSVAGGDAVRAALTKHLGTIDYPEAPGIEVEATYTPEDERYVALLVTERTHTTNLPPARKPELFVGGSPFALFDSKVITDSVHHRATSYRFVREAGFGSGHQVMTLRLASGQEASWHLPLMLPAASTSAAGVSFGERWALILALLGGMLAAMWPCLFQLTVYFIPALAGVAMQEGGSSVPAGRKQVLHAAFFFILGFTLVYTLTGAAIGYAAQQFGDTSQFDAWQRYVGIAAGVVVIGLALRVAAKVRAPLVCRMPILSRMADSKKPATRLEMMLAGLAFATGCMTCFGSALVIGMVVYVGLAQSALYGALVLFLFSIGMGIPLVIAAVAMARALPALLKLERAVPWMGLASAVLMAAFGTLLISGNYMVMSEWAYRLAGGLQ
jgi:cytochrome c-type biogenesis protein